VVVFGYTSHIFLPSLEASMAVYLWITQIDQSNNIFTPFENPKQFEWMLNKSHLAAAIFKSAFGLIGFLVISSAGKIREAD